MPTKPRPPKKPTAETTGADADAAAADHAARVARALRAAKLDARLKRKALATPQTILITDPPEAWVRFNSRWMNYQLFFTADLTDQGWATVALTNFDHSFQQETIIEVIGTLEDALADAEERNIAAGIEPDILQYRD